MTVEQLIERLKEFPPYREVKVGTKSIRIVRESQVTYGSGDSAPFVGIGTA